MLHTYCLLSTIISYKRSMGIGHMAIFCLVDGIDQIFTQGVFHGYIQKYTVCSSININFQL